MSAEDTMPAIALPQEQDPDLVREPPGGAVPALLEPAPEPAEGRFREPVPGLREPAPEPVPGQAGREPGTGAALVPAVAAPEERISLAGHLFFSLCAWAARAAASQKAHRSFWHWLWEGFWGTQPESLRQHRQHLKSRTWLADYLTGWVRTFAEWENIAYHWLIGRPGVAAGNSISRVAGRQSRFWVAVIIAFAAFIIWKAAHN